MSKIYKEIGIGFIPVLLIFLAFLGFNDGVLTDAEFEAKKKELLAKL